MVTQRTNHLRPRPADWAQGHYEADDKAGALEAIVAFADLYETGSIPKFADVVAALVE